MVLKRSLVAGLVLAAAVAGHPAVKHEKRLPQGPNASPGPLPEADVTVFDGPVAQPTVLSEMVAWVNDDGLATSTSIADVLVLPTGFMGEAEEATPEPSPEPTTTITLTASSTTTVTVASTVDAAASTEGEALVEVVLTAPAVTPDSSLVDPPPAPGQGNGKGKGKGKGKGPRPGPKPAPGSGLMGISYAPYRADHLCKTAGEIDDDFSRFSHLYSTVRIYGTDCGQVPMIYEAAMRAGMKLFLGIWDLNTVELEADAIASGIGGDWDAVKAISVGNELVNNGQASPEQVVAAVQQARQALRARGYQGPVVAVDTFIAAEAHPELCDASDFCAINAHSFFDSSSDAANAGQWLSDTVSRVKSRLASPGMKVMVTETGWPTRGAVNGLAVPSMENQRAALASIREAFSAEPEDVILFSAFNDLWKASDMATFMADQYWGVDGAISGSDM